MLMEQRVIVEKIAAELFNLLLMIRSRVILWAFSHSDVNVQHMLIPKSLTIWTGLNHTFGRMIQFSLDFGEMNVQCTQKLPM